MSVVHVLVLWCCLASVGRCFLLDDNSVQSLLSAIQTEKLARASLEADISALRATVASLNTRHVNSQCVCPPSKAVAFSATLTSDITNLGDSQPIVFDKVITNTDGVYDSRHGSFRAPVGGTYKFTFSVLQGTASTWIAVDLVLNGNVIGRVKTGSYGYYDIGTNVVNVHLAAGDDVWVQHNGNQGSDKIVAKGGGYTMFTGHLVTAD
ncbi:complement C1q tumor necrosis factor-related protein 2-like [Mya arenaria]|uniref:complement C1q tumor necrosis factor-related protein 2-like n=1 Tax=Mya arenaria TaxID=6604 RepID=UPI0022E1357E|nr:complement C1q tumor necrosis factor-related protein 2-like [Mya arenaria]